MRLVLAGFLLVGLLFVGVLVDLQTSRAERLRDLGESQRTGTRSLAGYRGSIVDRDGFVLAASTPSLELIADPQLVADAQATATILAPALGVAPESLLEALLPEKDGDRYGLVVESLDDATVGRLTALFEDETLEEPLAGLAMRPAEDRVNPADTLGRPVVGAVSTDGLGSSGVEWQFQEYLAGEGGLEHFERGVFGSINGGEWSVEPAQPGSDIMLTLDHRIQYVVEQALIEHCQEMNARGANAVVADPRTGEILAMATVRRRSPGVCYVPKYNASIVDTYEPGSVLKVVTFAAAISELGYTGDTLIAVPPSITVGDKTFPDHPRHPAADYPISQIAANSMNVGTIQLAQDVGAERLYDYLMAFGFGQETGLGFKDEATGTVPSTWQGSEAGSIPIGQGITVNTVQLLSAYNIIANDGMYVAPKLVRSVVAPDGTRQLPEPREARPVITAAAAAEVTRMLTGVVDFGTGTAASVPGYTVAGKTGTAWKVQDDGPYQGTYGVDGARDYVVTFAGFLPAESPQLSIVVVVDEPTVETTAGTVAAPVFADIAHYVLRILGIPPGTIDTENVGPVRGAPAGLSEGTATTPNGIATNVPTDASDSGMEQDGQTDQDAVAEQESSNDEDASEADE